MGDINGSESMAEALLDRKKFIIKFCKKIVLPLEFVNVESWKVVQEGLYNIRKGISYIKVCLD